MPKSNSKPAPKKSFKFSAEVALINSGRIEKITKFTNEEVDKLCNPIKKQKDRKRIEARIYEHKIVFKEKITGGNRKKKLLKFPCISFVDQPSGDIFKVFLQYEKPNNAYFFVLEFKEAGNVKDFIQLVKTGNKNSTVRREYANDTDPNHVDSNPHSRSSRRKEDKTDTNSLPRRNASPIKIHSSHDSESLDDVPAKTTFVTSWGGDYQHSEDDIKNTKGYTVYKPNRSNLNDAEFNKRTGLVTKYTYIGPKDDEESINGDHEYTGRSSRIVPSRLGQQEITRYPRSEPEHSLNIGSGSVTVKSKKNKSRQIPLSEEEKIKTGWHSDIMFVTPKADGGIEVSDDGPVLLYTATRDNFLASSDEEDDESSFGNSSSTSTISIGDEMDSQMYRTYSRGFLARS